MRDYLRHTRGRMFESDFFEFFSKVHPAAPFVFWVPILVGTQGWALASGTTSWSLTAALFPLGWVAWQLMEYVIHRHLFHWEGRGPLTRRFHAIVHGFHHKYPDDEQRLVMPLPVSIGLAVVINAALLPLGRPDVTLPLWNGVLAGYLFYDFTHWSTHFRKPRTEWGRRIRAHHMSHHFADHETNYGISHRWFDGALGTLRVSGVHVPAEPRTATTGASAGGRGSPLPRPSTP